MADTFTIKAIVGDSVDVIFSVDGKQQNISGLPVDNAEALKEKLSEYAVAYAAGLSNAVKKPVASVDSISLLNKPQAIKLKAEAVSEVAVAEEIKG